MMPTIFEELPFAYVISTSKKSSVCHFCCNATPNLRRCSGCRFAYYCSESCQKRGWHDHRLECANLKRISPRLPTDTARLMARIIFIQENACRSDEGGGKRTFGMLMSHVNEIQNDPIRMEHFTYLFAMLKEFIGEEKLPPSTELLEIFGKICINSFSIVDSDGNEVGVGLYLQLSLLDHSCNPDAVVVFDGPKAILNSVNAANESDDLTRVKISYIDLLCPSLERKRQLNEQYYFSCCCSRCNDKHEDDLMESFACTNGLCEGAVFASSSEDHIGVCEACRSSVDTETAASVAQQIKWQIEDLESLQKHEDFSTVYQRCSEMIKKADQLLHPFNFHFIRLLDIAFDSAIQLEMWPIAIEYGQTLLRGRCAYYPRGHPAITYQLAKVGKLLQYVGDLEKAEPYLQQALDQAELSHGGKHQLYATIGELLATCREERRVALARADNERRTEA